MNRVYESNSRYGIKTIWSAAQDLRLQVLGPTTGRGDCVSHMIRGEMAPPKKGGARGVWPRGHAYLLINDPQHNTHKISRYKHKNCRNNAGQHHAENDDLKSALLHR